MADGKLRAARQLSALLISSLTAELFLPHHMAVACSPARKGLGSWPGVHPKSWINVTWSQCGQVPFGLNDLLSLLGEGSGEKAYQLSAVSGHAEAKFSCLWSSIWCETAQCATAPGPGQRSSSVGKCDPRPRLPCRMGVFNPSVALVPGVFPSWWVEKKLLLLRSVRVSPARTPVHVWDLKSLAPRTWLYYSLGLLREWLSVFGSLHE